MLCFTGLDFANLKESVPFFFLCLSSKESVNLKYNGRNSIWAGEFGLIIRMYLNQRHVLLLLSQPHIDVIDIYSFHSHTYQAMLGLGVYVGFGQVSSGSGYFES